MSKRFISHCPVCEGELAVSKLSCTSCHTQIDTQIAAPVFFQLPPDLQEFVMVFLRNRGSIRDVEKELEISYPTVCKKLDLVNELLANSSRPNRMEILHQLERGEITAKEAAKLLREG